MSQASPHTKHVTLIRVISGQRYVAEIHLTEYRSPNDQRCYLGRSLVSYHKSLLQVHAFGAGNLRSSSVGSLSSMDWPASFWIFSNFASFLAVTSQLKPLAKSLKSLNDRLAALPPTLMPFHPRNPSHGQTKPLCSTEDGLVMETLKG